MESIVAAFDLVVRVARPVVFGIIAVTAVVCVLAWAVRTRRINPFGSVARVTRRIADPLIIPVERRVVRAGGMPASAPWWALAAVALVGLALLALLGFVRDSIISVHFSLTQGPLGIVRLLILWTFVVLKAAIIVRVIMSWVGGTYSAIGRVVIGLTEWFLAPLRGVMPRLGPIDITPLVAWFLLDILQAIVARVL